jgi:hypothetical protein
MKSSIGVIRNHKSNSKSKVYPKDSFKLMGRISAVLLSVILSSVIVSAFQLLPSSLQLPVAFAQQVSFNSPVTLDTGQGNQGDSHIASSGNTAYMSWTSEVDQISKILFAKSSNGGSSFEGRKTLSDDGGDHFAFVSDIAASGNKVYIVWTDVTDTESDIVFIKSTDGGNSFTQPIKLNTGNPPLGSQPAIAVSGSNVYVVWTDEACCPNVSDLDSDIYLAVSTNDGATFSSPINVYNNPDTESAFPSVAGSGSNVYVVWRDIDLNSPNINKILYAKSSNTGASFSSPVTLGPDQSFSADIKVSGNNVYVVYSHRTINPDSFKVFFVKSTDGGTTFGSPISFSDTIPDATRSLNPSVDVSGDNVAVTWAVRNDNDVNAHFEIFFRGSTDAGNTFSQPVSVSSALGNLESALNDVTLSGNNAYVTWTTIENGNTNTYFAAGTLTPSVTPVEGIENLIDTIDNMNLIKSVKTSLEGPLHNAIKLLSDNDPTNDKDACAKLDSFIQQVNAKEQNGQLTFQQATILRTQATAIQSSIPCSSANQLGSNSLTEDNSRGIIALPY